MNNDFYTWINNEWLSNNPIPDNESKWGNFDILATNNMLKLQDILANTDIDKPNRVNVLYYQLQEKFNYVSELKYYFNQIDSITDINNLMKLFVDYIFKFNLDGIISYYVEPDYTNSIKNILHINSAKLGLPSKDYYFVTKKAPIREKYKLFIKKYTQLFGLELDVYNLEEILASKIYDSIENADMTLINNKRTFEQIKTEFPNIAFMTEYFLSKINKQKEEINLVNVKYLKLVNELLNNNLLNSWKNYLKYKLCLSVNYFINESIEVEYNNFYKIEILGTKKIQSKWKRIINTIINLLGQDLGIIYIKYYYNPKTTDTMLFIINQVKNQIQKAIENNTWLDKNTIKRAIDKINKMDIKIGYPKENGLYNYESLNLNSNLFNNILNINYLKNNFEFNELYENKNKDKWYMHPFMVNAYYSPTSNEIVFPAGILQEPFFYENNLVKSFGGIGYIVGHEIIHAFDNRGRLYNEHGNLEDWWTPDDNIKYENKTLKVIEQYSNYKINDQYINGKLTLGENIADLGGIKFSLYGLIDYLKQTNKYNDEILKDFFYSYTNMLASHITNEDLNLRLLTDYHSPHIVRVNNVLKNINEFYQVFNIKEGSMYLPKEERLDIW